MRYYPAVGPAIPHSKVGRSRVTHPFAGDPLLGPLDLHVLSTPPAFVLSQDQTLQEILTSSHRPLPRVPAGLVRITLCIRQTSTLPGT